MGRLIAISSRSVLESSDVNVRSLAREDVEESPASWPVVWIAGARVFGPDPPKFGFGWHVCFAMVFEELAIR